MQLDELLDDLAKAKDIEAAAKRDVCDRAADHRETKDRLTKAEQRLAASIDQTAACRKAVHRVIEAQTHSAFDDEEA